jgi:hypothetical protein
MNLIVLTSGLIINVDQMCFVRPAPDPKENSLVAFFSAMAGAPPMGINTLRCVIEGSDIKPFLSAMEELGLKTDFVQAALAKKAG